MDEMDDQPAQDSEAIRQDLLSSYRSSCDRSGVKPYGAFVSYLEDTELDGVDLILCGNNKYNFTNRVDDSCLTTICRAVQLFSVYLQVIDLQYNLISDEGVGALAEIIAKAPRLRTLNLRGNDIESAGAQLLAEALKGSPDLEVLNLHGNRIGTRGAMTIADLLGSHERLCSMNIGSNEIGHDGVTTVLMMLNHNTSLQELNIENPVNKTICQATSVHYGKMFLNNVGLQRLSLRKHLVRDDGCYILMEHLLENTTLKVLDLDANEITFKGCEAIAKYLRGEYCALESLHLASNKVGDYGAQVLSQALAVNKSLVHLDLAYNNINDFGLTLLAQSLESNHTLMSFKVFWNHFGQDCLTLFSRLFDSKREHHWFPDFMIYWVDDHWEMAYLETNIEAESELGVNIHVCK